MRTTRSIQECIKDPARTGELVDFMARGRSERMQTFDQHLFDLRAGQQDHRRDGARGRLESHGLPDPALARGRRRRRRFSHGRATRRTARDRAGRALLGRTRWMTAAIGSSALTPRGWTSGPAALDRHATREHRRRRRARFRARRRRAVRCDCARRRGSRRPRWRARRRDMLGAALDDVAASRETQRIEPLAPFGIARRGRRDAGGDRGRGTRPRRLRDRDAGPARGPRARDDRDRRGVDRGPRRAGRARRRERDAAPAASPRSIAPRTRRTTRC